MALCRQKDELTRVLHEKTVTEWGKKERENLHDREIITGTQIHHVHAFWYLVTDPHKTFIRPIFLY